MSFHVPLIQFLSNKNYLQEYYEANLQIALSFKNSLQSMKNLLDVEPLNNNLITEDGTNFLPDTSIVNFIMNMEGFTDTFIETCLSVITDVKENQYLSATNASDKLTETQNNFFQEQSMLFKEFSNMLSMFVYFHDMTTLPQLFPEATSVISQSLHEKHLTQSIQLNNKSTFLSTNIAFFQPQKSLRFQDAFRVLSDSLRNASLTFERFPELTDANTSIETTFLTHLEDFYKFCQKTKIGINRYIYNQEKLFLILNADNVELSVIENHSQLTLEQSVYNIISEITSNDFIESLEVVEGSRGFNVNDIVEYETNASVRPIKTIVTSTIDGHVRHTTIPRLDGVEDGNDRTGFTPVIH